MRKVFRYESKGSGIQIARCEECEKSSKYSKSPLWEYLGTSLDVCGHCGFNPQGDGRTWAQSMNLDGSDSVPLHRPGVTRTLVQEGADHFSLSHLGNGVSFDLALIPTAAAWYASSTLNVEGGTRRSDYGPFDHLGDALEEAFADAVAYVRAFVNGREAEALHGTLLRFRPSLIRGGQVEGPGGEEDTSRALRCDLGALGAGAGPENCGPCNCLILPQAEPAPDRYVRRYLPVASPFRKWANCQGMIYAHRLVLLIAGADLEGMEVHHRNGIKGDNRLCNLQLVTPDQHREIHAQEVDRWEL